MQRKRQPERDDEPAVTFELEETPRTPRGGRAGAAAVAGAGLVSGAAASEPGESLDVFDEQDDAGERAGDVPTTSFETLGELEVDPEFPPIDFTATDEAAGEDGGAADLIFGATADVGGGFALDAVASDEAFGAAEIEVEPVADSLTEDNRMDELPEAEEADSDDFDLS